MHERKAMEKTKTENSIKDEWLGCHITKYPLIGVGHVLKIIKRANSRELLIRMMKGHGRFRIIKAEVFE